MKITDPKHAAEVIAEQMTAEFGKKMNKQLDEVLSELLTLIATSPDFEQAFNVLLENARYLNGE